MALVKRRFLKGAVPGISISVSSVEPVYKGFVEGDRTVPTAYRRLMIDRGAIIVEGTRPFVLPSPAYGAWRAPSGRGIVGREDIHVVMNDSIGLVEDGILTRMFTGRETLRGYPTVWGNVFYEERDRCALYASIEKCRLAEIGRLVGDDAFLRSLARDLLFPPPTLDELLADDDWEGLLDTDAHPLVPTSQMLLVHHAPSELLVPREVPEP